MAGAGPAGLSAAAALRRRGVPVVVLERTDAVGARWRRRYDGLRLNTMRQFSGLGAPRMRRNLGRYPTRDGFVGYLEEYARHHDLDIRFETELERVEHGDDGDWLVRTAAGPLAARHVVIATGYDAVPKFPAVPGRESYAGELVHAAAVRDPGDHAGRDVLIVGLGNTGVDLAGLLDRAGARVSATMRTPPNIVPRDLYGSPLQPSGILMDRLPAVFGDNLGRMTQRIAFGDLRPYGVPLPAEGYVTKFRRHLIGPAVDDGFVDGLKADRIRIVAGVERFEDREVVLADGTRLTPDVVICATGYSRGLEALVGHLGVLRPDGLPQHFDAPLPTHPVAPRLYFAGFYGSPAGQIRIFPHHARRIARAAARDR